MEQLRVIVPSGENLHAEKLSKKVSVLTDQVEELKTEITSFIDNVYVKHKDLPAKGKQIFNKSTQLQSKLNDLSNSCEDFLNVDVINTSKSIELSSLKLISSTFTLQCINAVYYIHEALANIRKNINNNTFVLAARLIIDVNSHIENIEKDQITDALEELKIRAVTEKVALLNKIFNIFTDNFSLNETSDGGERIIIVQFKKPNDEIQQSIYALYLLNAKVTYLEKFSQQLWKLVYENVILNTTTVNVSCDDEFNILKVFVESSKIPSYKDVFSNLKEVAIFVEKYTNFELKKGQTVAEYIGSQIRNDFSQTLIKHCLARTIPSTTDGLKKYDQVVENVQNLQSVLVECKMFNEETTSIIDYANDIDILFINKKCQEYLKASVIVMKKDLHDMVEVGTPENVEASFKNNEKNVFPQCSVSNSSLELINLVSEMLDLAKTSSDVCAGRLFCTAQNIFHQYGTVVNEHHYKLLQTIPQQIALFHNNCKYISHELMEWDERYKFPVEINSAPPSFKKQAESLSTLGSKTFEKYVQEQIKQIKDIIKESPLSKLHLPDKLDPASEKFIRQCLRQQELLRTVWHKVLPYKVYNETIGMILNEFCATLIGLILGVEDLSSDTAEKLVDILKVIITRGPKLFTDFKEIHFFVKNWYKFQELVFILSSNLMDINDRWADGKGPLALQFTPDEVKGLIRALFQNTDRRAAVLAKIHN